MTPLASFIVGVFVGFIVGVVLAFWGLDQRLLKESECGLDVCIADTPCEGPSEHL